MKILFFILFALLSMYDELLDLVFNLFQLNIIAELRRKTRKTKKKSQPQTSSDDSDDSSEKNLEYFSRVTRSGNTLRKLAEKIEKLMKDDAVIDVDGQLCVICCVKKKSVILLPCRHQHTCDTCWFLWCTESMNMKQDESTDESDDDATKPNCPYCRKAVDQMIDAIN